MKIPLQSIPSSPSPAVILRRWKEAILFSQLLPLRFDSPPGISFFQDYSSSNVSVGKRKILCSVFLEILSSALCKKRRAVVPWLLCVVLWIEEWLGDMAQAVWRWVFPGTRLRLRKTLAEDTAVCSKEQVIPQKQSSCWDLSKYLVCRRDYSVTKLLIQWLQMSLFHILICCRDCTCLHLLVAEQNLCWEGSSWFVSGRV